METRKNTKTEFRKDLIQACSNNDKTKLIDIFNEKYNTVDYLDVIIAEVALECYLCVDVCDQIICQTVEKGFTDIVKILIEKSFNFIARTHKGFPVQIACKKGHISLVKDLIYYLKANTVSWQDYEGIESLVAISTQNGHLDILEFLVHNGASLDMKTILPLPFYATINGSQDVLKYLLQQLNSKFDVNSVMRLPGNAIQEFSLLHTACITRQLHVIKFLIDKRCVVTQALVKRYPDCISDVLQQKISVYNVGEEGEEESHSALWNGICMDCIPDKVIMDNYNTIVQIDLNSCHLKEVTHAVYLLPNVTLIDLSLNELSQLDSEPAEGWKCYKLEKLNASKNELKQIPITVFVNLPNLHVLDVSYNHIQVVCSDETTQWNLPSIEEIQLSNNLIIALPDNMGSLGSLKILNVSNNRLDRLPNSLSQGTHKLDTLNLSKNRLSFLPIEMSRTWGNSLHTLNLKENQFHEIPIEVCQLIHLNILIISHNHVKVFPPFRNWETQTLQRLDISHNKLFFNLIQLSSTPDERKFMNLFAQPKIKPTNAKTQPNPIEYSPSVSTEDTYEVPLDLWANTLMYLDLSDNKISVLPDYIGSLTSLVSLNLSNNRDLNILPPALGRLKACYQLGVENLRLNNSLFNNIDGLKKTKSILSILRTELRNSVPSKNMKLMVVGLAGQGKTTLLQVMKNGSSKNESHKSTATNGVEINKWTLGGKDTRMKLGPEVDFSTWDLGGQEVYYATHQCFLTKNTLYLLVFNLTLGEDAILHLQPWLLNIQARAPNSPVIIVGTHLDKFRETNRGGAEEIREKVRKLYFEHRQNKYPDIIAVEFVSCTKHQNIDQLIKIIYETASSLKTIETQEKVIGQMIPKSYNDLQKLVELERETRRREGKMLILEYKEMERIAATVQDEELHDKAELDQAATYLHNNGHILHYDELIGQLSDIYFIDPTWICNMFSQIVTVKETNNWMRNGIIKEEDLQFIFLKDKFLFLNYQKEYLYIMEKFEVLINLGDGRLLIPSMLPLARPDVVDQVIPDEYQFHPESPLENPGPLNGPICIREQSAIIRRRIYFAFIPSGFWNRLISRILVGIKREEYCEPVDFSVNIDSKQILYWRRGIAMQFKDCRFVIESISRSSLEIGGMQPGEGYKRNTRILRGLGSSSEEDPSEVEGVDITVHSSTYDFSWLGYLVDQVDNILKEWFPGLDEQDIFGKEQIQRLCPWKIPKTLLTQMNEENKVELEVISGHYYYMFKYQDCVLLSVKNSHIYCQSLNVNIPLEFLIPEICLADLHEDFKLSVSELKFERKNSVIGEGATSNVFKGTYKNMEAAVKEFSYGNPNKKGLLKNTDIDIESTLQLLRMLRTEVSLQCRFQHPFILQLLGASIRPLVIVLELAPLGALSNTLTERANKLNEEWIAKYNATAPPPMPGGVLGHRMTNKIAMQVILAIEYLHNNKVIYRDLKAQNILLFSLKEDAAVNVKLSDYGISIVAQPSFNKGQEGTPGYIPPEGIAQKNFENVITEKVDIFAYGMVLYELITGRYPFYPRTAHQEVIKAVLNNINPDIYGQNRTPCCPNIIELMYECWRKSPAERPSAQKVIEKLINPAFYLLRNCFTEIDKEGMHKVDYMMDVPHSKAHTPSIVSRNLCVWGVETERKRCSLVNVENKKKIESRLPTEQPVGAACVVEEEGSPARIWISTRGQRPTRESGYREIEIYGQVSKNGSYCCLWRYITKDTVLCLVADNINGKPIVYASLLSGHFHAYARKADFENDRSFVSLKPNEYALTSERNNEECSQWKLVYVLQIGNPPVHSILVVSNEIWCACGGDIHLLNRDSREYFHKVSVFPNKDTLLTQMVHHDGRVYVTTFKGAEANVIVIDVGTRNVIGNMCCSEWNPNKQMVFLRNERTPGIMFATQMSTVDEMDEEGTSVPILITELLPEESASSRTQFVIPLDSPSLRYYPKQCSRSGERSQSSSRLQRITTRRDTGGGNEQKIVLESERKEVRIRSIMAGDGLLWVGRAMGDILLIDIDTESTSYGQVMACLRLPWDDKTIYSAKSISLLCPTQGMYIANYQQLLGRCKEAPRELITVWEAVGLKRLKEMLAENEMLLAYT